LNDLSIGRILGKPNKLYKFPIKEVKFSTPFWS
jgi:hypothetical protein